MGEVFRELARQKESRIEEGHLQADHVPRLLVIPPKYGIAQVGGAEREEGELSGVDGWGAAAEFGGGALLGTGILCLDRGARRGSRAAVPPGAGSRGTPTGAVRVV